jgi:riboflavin biosynthesis pyrimidine reductase
MSLTRNAATAGRPRVIAACALSWDGRLLETRLPARIDAVVSDSCECRLKAPIRVLFDMAGRIGAKAGFFRDPAGRVIVYAAAAHSSLAGMPRAQLHCRKDWSPARMLRHLRAHHGIDRLALAAGPGLFRRFAIEGFLDELQVTWQPRIAGGSPEGPLTGMEPAFFPRGIAFELFRLRRGARECTAIYRIRNPACYE